MTKNWGECYFDHYERFFGKACHREIFRQSSSSPTIQVLEYTSTGSTRIFSSLGLTHYHAQVGEVIEVFTFADVDRKKIPYILASSLFHAIQHNMTMGWGMVIGNLGSIDSKFVKKWGKSSLYFTQPYGMPPEGQNVYLEDKTGYFLEAIFITEHEREFFEENGAVAFEQLLEDNDVNVFELRRKSVV